MSHYSAFLRSYHSKSSKLSSSAASIPAVNNENDENTSIKNLILKHVTKGQQSSTNKSSMRGILGEVGNMTLNSKPLISKPKVVQQQNSIETLIECQTIVAVPPPPPCASTVIMINQIEEILLDDEESSIAHVSTEFDCDSADLQNITTASEYVVDICKYWRELEINTPIRQNFLLNRSEGRRDEDTAEF